MNDELLGVVRWVMMCASTVLLGCVEFDSASVRPTATAPQSTVVDAAQIPLDSSRPKYVLAVEPVQFTGTLNEQYTLIEGAAAGRSLESRTDNRTRVGEVSSDGGQRTRVGAVISAEPAAGTPGMAAANLSSGPHGLELSGQGGMATQESSHRHGREKENSRAASDRKSTAASSVSVYSWSRSTAPDMNAIRIAAQLTSALAGIKNFSLRDIQTLPQQRGLYRAAIRQGEVGPFIVRALVTEYNADAEVDKMKVNVFPGTSYEKDDRVGVVALDISVIDGRDGSVVTSFPAYGTFKWRKRESDIGIVFSGYSAEKQAKSVMQNAMRAALNDAAIKTFEKLSGRVR